MTNWLVQESRETVRTAGLAWLLPGSGLTVTSPRALVGARWAKLPDAEVRLLLA